jgi:hypothetical protein
VSAAGKVYALTTPRGRPFYVGATVQPVGTRVGQHLRDARRGRKGSAVHELLAETARCGIWVIEAGIERSALGARERHHKRRLERAGFELLNYHHGANGCNFQPAKVRERIRAFAVGRPRGPRGEFLPAMPAIAGGAPTSAHTPEPIIAAYLAGAEPLPF